ncbi:inositol 1,4,5-triphosphate receptor associated 2 isoform X2 [Brachyhypopomus gauderio]|uniref:inositol 1,4,5-triphosphate receptor associated 2 isoform X2 n=1 Tax=Brachyhypopomus gauderio TaxID=698409 RepID=UPI00404380DA
MDAGATPRRHNPVDSICRKLQTIRRRDQEADSPFPIPKLQSSGYDSPRTGLRHNLEAVLRKRGVRPDECERAAVTQSPAGCPAPRTSCDTPTPSTPATPVNATYSVTSSLRERSGAVPLYTRPWQRSCSTPAAQSAGDHCRFTPGCPTPAEGERGRGSAPTPTLLSYNLNFGSSDNSTFLDTELTCPTLVVKRLSMGDGVLCPAESGRDGMAEVSLICEEDLLDTIFQACDTQCRGKVYVSHIVDYLRHTTSRSSEDSGLEELCNMLDPEHKDISIDLHTYHAIMREWIEDCRNHGTSSKEDQTQESVRPADNLTAKRSVLFNMTSGSLEAFGGEVTRADLETSELVFCVADLQFNNQKLQQEVGKLKQAVEAVEETNQKLLEENEALKAQARVGQQLLQKERMLKEEVEEMKLTLSSSEERRARASDQSKYMERENQALLAKIASLEEENVRVSVELEELQKKVKKLCDLNTDLQVQIHSYDSAIAEKDAVIQEKTRQTEELKTAIEEYSSVTELLRAEKSKLERQIQRVLMQPDITLAGVSLSVAYRLNQTSSGSLQNELAQAQNPSEGVEWSSSSVCLASPLDETLDREVLLLLRGPASEQTALEFRTLITSLRREFEEDSHAVLTELQGLQKCLGSHDVDLKFQGRLEQRRGEWACVLEQLQQYTDQLEKELMKVTSEIRRSRTDMLHLSVRVQEQENQKRQLQEELDQLKTEHGKKEASSQTPASWFQVVEQHLPEGGADDSQLKQGTAVLGGEEAEEATREPISEEGPELHGCRGTINPESIGRSRPTHDSGFETDELGDSTPFQKRAPEHTDSEPLASLPLDEPQDGPSQQEEARLPECTGPVDTHGQAVCCEASESVSLSHSHTASVAACVNHTRPDDLPRDQDPTTRGLGLPAEQPPPETPAVVSSASIQSQPGQPMSLASSLPLWTGDMERGSEGEPDAVSHASPAQQTQEQVTDVPTLLDRICLLPVAEEEEPVTEAGQQVAVAEGNAVDMTKMGGEGTVTAPSSDSARAPAGLGEVGPDPPPTAPPPPSPRSDPPVLRTRFRRDPEINHSMEAIEEQKAQEDGEASEGPKNTDDTSVISEDSKDASMDDGNSLSSNDKEMEAEFRRLSLSCKCDMFTLDKRLRLEERSRDLAEENVRREVSSCQGLLQALIPRCEDDNQAMEIIQRLQKNLEILLQSMTRVSSRSEMLGAIHQESRTGKAVEVMIHHVENLRRTYTKEHAELLELRESLMQNERSFSTERDDFRNKKQPSFNKPAGRRVSLATIPRGIGGLPLDMAKDGPETNEERLARRSPWNIVGRSSQRAPLKRFVSSGGWTETTGPPLTNRFAYDSDSHSEEELRTEGTERRSSLTQLGIKFTSLIMPAKTLSSSPSPTAEQAAPCLVKVAPPAAPRSPWVWVAVLVVLAALVGLLASLVLQPAVDAAPVGTGDSWMTIQQLLWPYTGLRHNGQPPV